MHLPTKAKIETNEADMTINKKIIEALKKYGMPVAPDHYSGKEKRYFEFNLYDDTGAVFADEEPEFDIVIIQVHLFLPREEDYLRLKKQIRNSLCEAGFCYADITEMVEPESTEQYPYGIRHIIFETEIDED